MAKRRHNGLLFGLGMIGVASSLAYLHLSPEQKKRLVQLKDRFLHDTGEQVGTASEKIKDVTDSVADQGEAFTDAAGEKFGSAEDRLQSYGDDILKAVEDKFEELKKLLQKK